MHVSACIRYVSTPCLYKCPLDVWLVLETRAAGQVAARLFFSALPFFFGAALRGGRPRHCTWETELGRFKTWREQAEGEQIRVDPQVRLACRENRAFFSPFRFEIGAPRYAKQEACLDENVPTFLF